ncbi:protein TEX261 [Agrilus planipennis]|uniref:Protein TEX261 n=1 Tax=Agrilus planipennis TaxID=224129 RepID=A0A1W4WWD4_AGRPL|nr:protein TEX261 [Agrilus planipennis]
MWFFTILSYVAILIQICFVTIAIAAGLYYLAELVEEYTVVSKKIITSMNTATLILYLCLWVFEDLPKSMVLCGILAQLSHFVILKDFPYVSFLAPGFLSSILFLIVNHYMAFSYFAEVNHPISEVLAYFTICLWLVPFALFISLSANDYVLPTMADHQEQDVITNYFSKKNKKYGLLTLFNYTKDTIFTQKSKKGF